MKTKQILKQLTDAIGLPAGFSVGASTDNKDNLREWVIMRKMPNGDTYIVSKDGAYPTIKDLLSLKDTLDKTRIEHILSTL